MYITQKKTKTSFSNFINIVQLLLDSHLRGKTLSYRKIVIYVPVESC